MYKQEAKFVGVCVCVCVCVCTHLTIFFHYPTGQVFHVWVFGQYATQLLQYVVTLAIGKVWFNSHEQISGFLMRSEPRQAHFVHRLPGNETVAVEFICHNSWTLLQCVGHTRKVALEHSQRQVSNWLRWNNDPIVTPPDGMRMYILFAHLWWGQGSSLRPPTTEVAIVAQ